MAELEVGKQYVLCPTDKYKHSDGWLRAPGVLIEAKYVRREHLPKIGGDWETFYAFESDGLEREGDKGIMLRLRVPAGRLNIEGNRVIVDGILEEHSIIFDKHPAIVNRWIKEVEKIEERPTIPATTQ